LPNSPLTLLTPPAMTEKSAEAPVRRLWLIFFPVLIALGATTSMASNGQPANNIAESTQTTTQPSEQKLAKLRQEIGELRTELDQAQKTKRSAEDQLRVTEKSIGKINTLLRNLDKRIQRQDTEIAALNQRQQHTLTNIDQHKNILAKQLRATYLLGKQPYLKLLLNQQQPQKLSRTVTYFSYYSRAKLAQIEQLNGELQELRQLQQAIETAHQQIEADKSEKLTEKQNLETYHRQRVSLLASLNKEINNKDARLKHLMEDEQRLTALVQHLRSDEIPETLSKKPFAELKGSLLWPVQGPLLAKFGNDRNIGQLKWQGVMISSAAGSEVRAVSRGRVAFADWFRGFGLLIILDHGNGYMSLYGHNDSLYKENGDWVEANEVIARVGPGSSKLGSGLYFELRHNGKPINPLRWCKNMPNR
jgi:septal ring factor EnvC (AmiA/AmiB activator)